MLIFIFSNEDEDVGRVFVYLSRVRKKIEKEKKRNNFCVVVVIGKLL